MTRLNLISFELRPPHKDAANAEAQSIKKPSMDLDAIYEKLRSMEPQRLAARLRALELKGDDE